MNKSPNCFSYLTIILWGCLVIGLLSLTGCAQQRNTYEVTNVYEYPIKPGSREWLALGSHDEMLKVCQIPEEILSKMSTDALVETVLKYPLYGDMLAYLNLQEGFNSVSANFNGISTLMNRNDSGTALLKKYHSMNPEALDKRWGLEEQGQYDASFTYIEMLLAQDVILSKLTSSEQQDLLAAALAKGRAKQKHIEVYGHFGLERTALLLGRTLQKKNFVAFNQKIEADTTLQLFLNDAVTLPDALLNDIFTQTEMFLAQN